MSRLAITLSRDTSAACSARGGSTTSRNTPSMRKRTTERASYGSKCRSDARSRSACSNKALIIRITGASDVAPSRSSACGISCSSRARSASRDRSPENWVTGAAWLYAVASSAAKRSALTVSVFSGRCRTRLSSAMPSTDASLRASTRTDSPSSFSGSTPCMRANAYGTRSSVAGAALAPDEEVEIGAGMGPRALLPIWRRAAARAASPPAPAAG